MYLTLLTALMGAFFATDSRANSIDESRRTAVVRAVARVQPSVASLHVRYRERTRQLYQFRSDPLWNFFSPFYYIVPQDRVSTGSGFVIDDAGYICLLYTSPSPRDGLLSRMPSSA